MSKTVVPVVFGNKTFFVTKSSNFVVSGGHEDGTRISDGIHNNGGWVVGESYQTVVKKITEAYEQLG